jgi:hypothetical protein
MVQHAQSEALEHACPYYVRRHEIRRGCVWQSST